MPPGNSTDDDQAGSQKRKALSEDHSTAATRAKHYGGLLDGSGSGPRREVGGGPAGTSVPASLQEMLLVADGVRRERPSSVAPSPLLARMQHFLPKLAAANAALPKDGQLDFVEVVPAGHGRFGESFGEIDGTRARGPSSDARSKDTESKSKSAEVKSKDEGANREQAEVEVGGIGDQEKSRVTGDDGDGGVKGDICFSLVEDGADSEDVESDSNSNGARHSQSSSSSEASEDSEDDACGAVEMDVYIDDSLGEIVAKEDGGQPEKRLIEELPSRESRKGTTVSGASKNVSEQGKDGL